LSKPDRETPQEFQELWMTMGKRYFPLFHEIYESEEEIVKIGLGFQQMYKHFGKAFYEFYTISEYYRTMKSMKADFVRLVMVTSLIEKLNSTKDYITFSEWIAKKQGTQKIDSNYNALLDEYNQTYGSSGKFRLFFQKYLSEKEQTELLTSVLVLESTPDGLSIREFVPLFCYRKELCYDNAVHCKIGQIVSNCPAIRDKKILKDGIREFAEFLYQIRNKFVHNAVVYNLPELASKELEWQFTYIPYKFKYIKSPPFYNDYVLFRIAFFDIEKIFERNFKKLLKNYIEGRRKEKYRLSFGGESK
jgi:hypothetical protein